MNRKARRAAATESPDRRFAAAAQAFGAGRTAEAKDLLTPLLAAFPDHPDVNHLAGAVALSADLPEEASLRLSHALAGAAAARRDDIRPAILNLLGSALRRLGRTDEALAALHEALALRPNLADAHYNLGNALVETARFREAADHYAAAVRLDPAAADARVQLGFARVALGDTAGAIAEFERVRREMPERIDAMIGLGGARFSLNQYRAAAEQYRQASARAPDNAAAHANLGVALLHLGQPENALTETRRAVALAPDDPVIHSKLVHHLHYVETDGGALLAEARRWDECHARPCAVRIRPHTNVPDPERRLRIGYVSADFRRHPVGYSMKSVLAAHDKNAVEIFCYTNSAEEDDLTAHFRSSADAWRNVTGFGDRAVADLVRADAVDILIDLAGHTGGHRLLAFAERPAPIQASAVGGSGTTGVAAVDYMIADRFQIPSDLERFYTEDIVRLPGGWLCYAPPVGAPEVALPPSAECGAVTFGSFNNPGKLSLATLALWARVLNAVPTSRLLLKGWAFGDGDDRARFSARAASAGIDPDRLVFEPGSDHRQYLTAYGRVDIALDPMPFSGGLTTLDALWMGVPVVTLPGQSFASRYSAAHLSNAGLGELIAGNVEEYVTMAVALAADRERLRMLRAGLRARVAASPLCDGKRYARDLEAAYRGMWRAWCDGRRNPLDRA